MVILLQYFDATHEETTRETETIEQTYYKMIGLDSKKNNVMKNKNKNGGFSMFKQTKET